jgi:hypothetical protein
MIRRLLLTAALLTTSACLNSTMRVNQTLSPDLADLASMKTLEVRTQGGDVLLRGTFSEGSNSSGKLERTASLTNPETNDTRGTASIQIERTNGLAEEELIVKLDELPYPESCRLIADGREVTIFSTLPEGKMEFKLTRRVSAGHQQ